MSESKDLLPYQEERPWGSFRKFTENTLSTVKILSVKPGESFSLQIHAKRTEFWRVIKGDGKAEIGDALFNVVLGDEHTVPVGSKHRLTAGLDGLDVLEISLGDFDEEDITRLEDKYGRA